MAGFLNAFNKSFERPGEQADIDPNEQRRYTKIAMEGITNTGGVIWDPNKEDFVGDINSVTPENRAGLLRNITLPSKGANGEIVEFNVSDLIEEKDGSGWVLGLTGQDGAKTIATDSSDANPNAPVTKFTTEQINLALANNYRSLAALGGGIDAVMTGKILSQMVPISGAGRQEKLRIAQAADARARKEGETFNELQRIARAQGNVETERGAYVADKNMLSNVLAEFKGGAQEDQTVNSLFPGYGDTQASVKQTQEEKQAALDSQGPPPVDATTLDEVQAGTTSIASSFLRTGDNKSNVTIPRLANSAIPGSLGSNQFFKDYPELKDFEVKSGSSKANKAARGVTYIRALEENGMPINLEENSFITNNWDVVGQNVKRFQERDRQEGLPAGTTLLSVQSIADDNKQKAENMTIPGNARGARKSNALNDRRNLLNPETAINTALLVQAKLNQLGDIPKLIDPSQLKTITKSQKTSDSVTSAANTNAINTVVDNNGNVDESAADGLVTEATEIVNEFGITSPRDISKVKSNLGNDIKMQRVLTAASLRAALRTSPNGTVSFDKNMYDTFFDQNWNTYTTGDPNISRKDLMSKTTSGSATPVSNWIDATKKGIGDTDKPLAIAATNLNALQVQSGTSLFGLISTWNIKTSGPKEEELVKSIATFKTAAAESLEQLTRFKEQIKLGSEFANFGTNVPEAYQGTIKRLEDAVVTNLLISAGLSREPGGLAAWVASWGVDDQQFDAFTNLDNFIIVPSKDGVTKNTRIMAIGSNGEPRNTEFTVGQLENSINKKNANKLVSILLERQKNNERTAKLLKERGEGGDVFIEKTK